MHPSSERLFELIARSDPTKATKSVRQLIESLTSACSTCQSFRSAPLRFKASIPKNNLIFNHTISIDLVWLNDKPVIHVIDEQTKFRNAVFIKSKKAIDIWNAFVGCWVNTYIGFPSKIRSDQESAVTSDEFRQIASANGVILEFSGVNAHNAMGQIESAHGPLRRIFRLLNENHSSLSENLKLRLAVKALNDTAGPKGLVSSLLVFGTIPSLGNTNANLVELEDRFRAMHAARAEAAKIVAEQRIQIALRSNIPPSAKYQLRTGQTVMAYSEKQRRWVKDLKVVRVANKQIWINNGKRVFNLGKPHVVPQPCNADVRNISSLLRRLSPLNSHPLPHILLTEILKPNDPRCESIKFDEAKAKEIVGLLNKKAFRVVLKEEIEPDANVLGGRFVLTIKNKDTDHELFKARFVVQGHLDREKELLVHASTTVSQQAVKLLLSLATIFGFRLWSEDMTLAYIQGAKNIMRKVYLKGELEFQPSDAQLLKILRPLYGLADSGDYWHANFLQHLKSDLNMQSTACDLSFFYKHMQAALHGLMATHVDDTLSAGNHKFDDETRITGIMFDAKPRTYDNLTFAGVTINTNPDGSRLMHQTEYAQKIQPLDKNCTYEEFRSRRHKLAWITHTRPDVAVEAAILAQITQQLFQPTHITQLNRAIKRIKDQPELGLIVHKLDLESLRLIVHAHISFGNLPDYKTQLGFVVLLSDKTNRVNWFHYRSYKCKRVVRSVLGGETHAFADAFDASYAIRHDLQKIMLRNVPLCIVTDSDSLFKVIVQSSNMTENAL